MYNNTEMPSIEINAKGAGIPLPKQPVFAEILDRLRMVANQYERITIETHEKLQVLKRLDQVPQNSLDNNKPNEPNSITGEIIETISHLERINFIAEDNLRHLNQMV